MHAAEIDRYRELRPLGFGGMGEVVLAEDTLLRRNVALKRLRASGDEPELGRLRREALVGASFNHPNLVAVYDTLLEDDDLVIVMEYVEGQTLRAALAGGALPAHRALDIISAVAAALDHVHARNVVHRDVKPANVLLGLGAVVKLGDLGIASAADRTRITSIGTVLGTIPYMAPEQLETSRPTPAVDVYALGAVAFEALCGRRARNETNPLALAHALATQPAPDLREVWPDAPDDAAAVLAKAMARDPAARPRSAGDLAQRLRAALAADPTTAPAPKRPLEPRSAQRAATPAPALAAAPSRAPRVVPAAPPSSRRRPQIAAAALGLLALGTVAAIALSSSGGSSSPTRTAASAGAAHRSAVPPRPAGASGNPAAASGSPGPVGNAADPVAAVKSFYMLAAAHRFAAAWALADPAFRTQLQGLQSFSAQQSAVRSIRFDSAKVTAAGPTRASVAVRTTPTLDSGVQHCRGTVQVTRASANWQLHHIAIQC